MDLRRAAGAFFALTGLILLSAWLAGAPSRYRLTVPAVNLWAGLTMLALGTVLIGLARIRPRR